MQIIFKEVVIASTILHILMLWCAQTAKLSRAVSYHFGEIRIIGGADFWR